jgi:hypothetical protein
MEIKYTPQMADSLRGLSDTENTTQKEQSLACLQLLEDHLDQVEQLQLALEESLTALNLTDMMVASTVRIL